MLDKWFKKEKPFQGLTGFGGGATGRLVGGVVSSISSASGGNIHDGVTPGNGYKYHVFTTPGTFSATVEGVEYPIEILAVAAGRPGGRSAPGSSAASGAGGGGGGVVVKPITLIAGTTPISVTVAASQGNNSIIGSSPQPFYTTVYAGGLGGRANDPAPQPAKTGNAGGSGGGGADNQPGGAGNQPPVSTPLSPQQGYPGGNAPGGRTGGGGGGSGEAGYNAGSVHVGGPQDPLGTGSYPNLTAGDGGNGAPYPGFAGPLFPGMPSGWQTAVTADGRYGGGGGGGGYNYSNPGPKGGDGGLGGGGNGGNRAGGSGVANTGGGGGGGGAADSPEVGGNGASGIVIVRYAV